MNIQTDRSKHPCFNREAAGSCGRVHLPVAPKCNILCNYCNRQFDCVNESRPGVSSAVLSPAQAAEYMDLVLQKEPRITVAGIAGPGDPFANAQESLLTMRLLKERHPQLLFCLASNGLALPAHVDALAELGVTHVTITINAVDPKIGQRIYSWVRDGKVVYRGLQAAELLLSRQMEALHALKKHGVTVKINTIIIPGVNDGHVADIAKVIGSAGADLMNCMPMHPNPGTPFGELPEPGKDMMETLRAAAEPIVPQMRHCKRCRADAVGLLDNDRSIEMCGALKKCSQSTLVPEAARPYVAVATREGLLVNVHLGEASRFQIWEQTAEGHKLVGERESPRPGCGPKRWEDLAKLLNDCRAVLVAAVGETPRKILTDKGIKVHECSGFIEDAVAAAYGAGDLSVLRARKKGLAAACPGGGGGCGG